MLLPKDLLPMQYTDTWIYTKPRLFLCEVDKSKICQLETTALSGSFKFNSYSELECTVSRTYEDFISGENKINPFYDKIEALRLLYLEGFGYFEIQEPEITSDGISEIKNITAYSLEYTLSQKYLTYFYINTGEVNSQEVIYKETNGKENIVPVSLYNPENKELSLLHLCLSKVYGWSIKYVDPSIASMTRTFEISRESVYDFFINDVSDKFNCFFVFDTINNTISVYAESLITKFRGDGHTRIFTVSSLYDSLYTVSIDGYKTTKYSYDKATGKITFDTAPAEEALIEVVDGSQAKYMTDVYISFENLAQEVNISYSADDIKTVLTVKGADDIGIEEVNTGLPYITDLSYYYTVDWMGRDLYDAYTLYSQKCSEYYDEYASNAEEMRSIYGYKTYENNRFSLKYSIASAVNSQTVGTYYVRGGSSPDYYYTEVTLPDQYSTNVPHYYTLSGNDLNENKLKKFFSAMGTYYMSGTSKETTEIKALAADFSFVENYTITSLISALSKANTTSAKDTAFNTFLDEVFDQLGLKQLNEYLWQYKQTQEENINAGWNEPSNENYMRYYAIVVMINAINKDILDRQTSINAYNEQYNALSNRNAEIQSELLMSNNFTQNQLIRLNAFLREDEYTDDNFVLTDIDDNETTMRIKQELLECGKIELSKLSEPKLEFSMDMANIYALPEFEPIVHQFQLGNLINVAIRRDYIKRARLLQVNINFDDFSDFTCDFGELSDLKTPINIHADLLSQALSAGKSVASNASYWNKGADLATQTDLKIQQGLLDGTNGLYSSDQGVVIDKSGIRLTKIVNKETGEVSPYQAWIVNNNILFSTDGFKTSQTGLGEFEIDGTTFYGLLAQAVLSGYIEGSTIVGGTINIGNGTFMVDEFGNVTMGGDSKIGNLTAQDIQDYIESEDNIVYTSCPIHGNYLTDEIWIVGERDYIQTDEKGNVVDSAGNIIAPISMGTISDDKTSVLDSDENVVGTIDNEFVLDSNDVIIGIYYEDFNRAFTIVGYLQNGIAVDSTGTSIGEINRNVVTNGDTLVGLVSNDYVISAEIIGTTEVNWAEPGSMLRSINDGNGVYKSIDWISALDKYDQQNENLNTRVGSIEGNLDQHFEFSNDKGLVIKDGKISVGESIKASFYTEQNTSGVNIAYIRTNQDTSAGVEAGLAIHNTSVYVPDSNNSGIVNLGSSGCRWNQLYAENGSIDTSDKNKKKDIEDMSDIQEQLFNELKPVTYKMISGTSDRTHYGFIAQDIEESLHTLGLSGKDFAGFCKDVRIDDNGNTVVDENKHAVYDYGLRYSEFIALNTYMIQKLQNEISELKAEIQELKGST